MKDYYKILEVDKKAEFTLIKKSYYSLAMKHHPDKNNNSKISEEKFKDIVEAYEILSNPQKRKRYDISLKNNNNFNFELSDTILKFSKLFFSQENIKKFNSLAYSVNNNIKNMGINIDFELLLNTFLTNIRKNKYNDLYSEFSNFKKFYEFDINQQNEFNDDKYSREKFKEDNIREKYNSKINNLKKNRSSKVITKIPKKNIPKKNYKNKFINININVELDNIYNKVIKYVPININKPCLECNGKGIISIKTKKNVYKNEKCKCCLGKSFIVNNKDFTIDTSVDKICYLNEHYINDKEGYYDIIFTIKQKPHSFIKKKNRYDLEIDREINLYEYYYGGVYNLDYLDNKNYEIKFNGFNNSLIKNTIKKKNLGLLFVDENTKYNNDIEIINNRYFMEERGDLYINFILKLPIYDTIKLKNIQEKIKDIV